MALLDSPMIQSLLNENISIERQMQNAYSRLTDEGNLADASVVATLLEENSRIREAVYADEHESAIRATEACHRIIDQYPALFDRIESWFDDEGNPV